MIQYCKTLVQSSSQSRNRKRRTEVNQEKTTTKREKCLTPRVIEHIQTKKEKERQNKDGFDFETQFINSIEVDDHLTKWI